jgi:hypothetical protein
VCQPTVSIPVSEDEPRPVRSDTIARALAFSSMLDRVNLATCADDPFR